jgi:uncharacterized protein (TIGR02679 family)
VTNPYEGAEYRRLLRAARRSLERTGGDLSGSVSLGNPSEAERLAVIGITGQYRPAGTARLAVRLADLELAVREATGDGLAELLAELGGPLRDRPAEVAKHVAERETTVRSAEMSFLFAEHEWYREWLAVLARDGTLTKLVNTAESARVGQAVRVLESLAARAWPAETGAPVLLPELAAAVTGDTKALNPGTMLSTLVLRALSLRALSLRGLSLRGLSLQALPLRSLEPGAGGARFDTAEARRELWDLSDVVVDDLASRVLVLNLPAFGDGLGEWLTGAARVGVPFYVTLQQLAALPVRFGGGVVHVCENPAVLRRAAADLGAASSALVCTEGRPSTAFHQVARGVVESGGELAYHGDFDWPGVAIAAAVMRRHGARAWRMDAADYLAAVSNRGDSVPLAGAPQPTPWDPELGEAMTATGRAVYEEAVVDILIADLQIE